MTTQLPTVSLNGSSGLKCFALSVADTYLHVPPRRYVFSGAEAHGRLIEEDDDDADDDDDDSSLVSADDEDRLADGEGSDNDRPTADTDANCTDSYSCPLTPPEVIYGDSSNGSLDP